MSLQGMPGINGILGMCVVCDGTFIVELLDDIPIKTVSFPQFEGSFAVHSDCFKHLERAHKETWESLPEGQLRRTLAEAARREKAQAETPDADKVGNDTEDPQT